MTITGIASGTDPYQVSSGQPNLFKQMRHDVEALEQALQAGDLPGARQAFSTLQQVLSSPLSGTPSQGSAPGTATNPLSADLASLGQALQSGDVTSAQTAFARFVKDLQTGRHRHHHHHQQDGSSAQTAPLGMPTQPIASSISGTTVGGGTDSDGDHDNSGSSGFSAVA